MQKVKNTIPVYDICSLNGNGHLYEDIVADNLAHYLEEHTNLYFPHRHSFYHIVLFTHGCGSHTIDFEQFTVKPGQLYFMVPGQVHTWQFQPGVDGYIINFSDALLSAVMPENEASAKFPFFRGIASESVFELSNETLSVVTRLMAQVVAETHESDQFSRLAIIANLARLFVAVARFSGAGNAGALHGQNNTILFNFRKLVGEHFATRHLPKDYAEMLYITPNHLNAICNDLLGKSAGDVIRQRILLEAKRLLVNANISVAEVAWQLGFEDNSYFTKFFRKYSGANPDAFRKEYLKHFNN